MATATIQVRMDSALKKETEAALKSMGLNMSTAIHLFCRQVVNQGRIPFDIVAPNIPNAETRKVLDDALAGKNLSRSFSTVDEMWDDLNA
ncbi:type II toxin-antitoxin system RelB/DinJ family antitoxin [Selenomonas caprae]|uniref:DNA-damage-inducible protein J n=2 Tax=Selenomonas TaxID=970 RepID=A0A1I3BJB8_SELRU|nr:MULTISPECIES: type II toxin-antitoxin system RelB/DinJ family antitoxin [Selenomonas]TYZ27774.1 type II toxin-antitoxin system RelB/DinJ family antitoxin [Selenomonas caprae]SFH62250.1 DNA-damage-inducible protein J [Selenomonas ruminantium]SFT48142.1 DNA-damage-inducible protein J [Selenomonas ruminantium]